MFISEENIKKVSYWLSVLAYYTKINNLQNLTDINTLSEDFFCKLLNAIFNIQLVNLNPTIKKNYPAVDLGDKSKKLCFQVTADDTSTKIKDTILIFEKNERYKIFTSLKFLLTVIKKRNYSFNCKTNGLYSFCLEDDLLDLNDLVTFLRGKDEKVFSQVIDILSIELKSFEKENNINIDSIEGILITELFKLISSDEDIIKKTFKKPVILISDLNEKKSRFAKFWSFIEDNYKRIISTKREKRYYQAFSAFKETDIERVQEYLRLEGEQELINANYDPIVAIDKLINKIIRKYKLSLISEIEVKYFLYYQLYNCRLFPKSNS